MNPLLSDYQDILDSLADEGRLRRLHGESAEALLDCTSNDYMAIGADRGLRREFLRTLDEDAAFGSCASRLLYTSRDSYGELEHYLASLFGREVLLFNSGYHANVGIITALALPGTLIVADKLVHASAIDGIRLSGAPFRRFRHNDTDALERILQKEAGDYRRVIVVVESVYSMDGDCAPLKEIVSLKERFGNMMLYVDEAHAFGVCGERGLGLSEQLGIVADVDILVGTLSKGVASVGAFAVVGDVMKQYLVNSARSLIFSTAIPPVSAMWSRFVIERLVGMSDQRRRLAEISGDVSQFLCELTGRTEQHSTPIVPFMIGGNHEVLRAAEAMKRKGVMALPIRRPTVAAGSERIRISLNAAMSDTDVASLKEAVAFAAKEVLK